MKGRKEYKRRGLTQNLKHQQNITDMHVIVNNVSNYLFLWDWIILFKCAQSYLPWWESGCNHLCDGMVCNCIFLYTQNHGSREYILQSSWMDILYDLSKYAFSFIQSCVSIRKKTINKFVSIYVTCYKMYNCLNYLILKLFYIEIYLLFIIYILVLMNIKGNQYFTSTV